MLYNVVKSPVEVSMSPRSVVFDRRSVVAAALHLVREQGWEALTARAVADRLGASVAPLYKTFASMADLEQAVLEAARHALEEFMRRTYSGMEFLNVGVGLAEFARDEPNLFRALFQARHKRAEIVAAIADSIIGHMKGKPLPDGLCDDSLRQLFDHVRLYTLGLATAVVAGWWPDSSTAALVRELGRVGHIFIVAEAGGMGAYASLPGAGAGYRQPATSPAAVGPAPVAPKPEVAEEINNRRFFEED